VSVFVSPQRKKFILSSEVRARDQFSSLPLSAGKNFLQTHVLIKKHTIDSLPNILLGDQQTDEQNPPS